MTGPHVPPKPEVFDVLLQRGRDVYVWLDPRRAGVLVPEHLRDHDHAVLCYSLNAHVPIPDLSMELTGIRATLSFDRRPIATFVPWTAVFMIRDGQGQGVGWGADCPPDFTPTTLPPGPPPPPEVAPPRLAAVKDDAAPPDDAPVGHAGWTPRLV